MEQHGARFSEFGLVYFAVGYKYTKSSKRGKNFPQDFFYYFTQKNVNFSQSVCFKLFNAWSSRHDKQVKALTIVSVIWSEVRDCGKLIQSLKERGI